MTTKLNWVALSHFRAGEFFEFLEAEAGHGLVDVVQAEEGVAFVGGSLGSDQGVAGQEGEGRAVTNPLYVLDVSWLEFGVAQVVEAERPGL